jgi:hypothetical protein
MCVTYSWTVIANKQSLVSVVRNRSNKESCSIIRLCTQNVFYESIFRVRKVVFDGTISRSHIAIW